MRPLGPGGPPFGSPCGNRSPRILPLGPGGPVFAGIAALACPHWALVDPRPSSCGGTAAHVGPCRGPTGPWWTRRGPLWPPLGPPLACRGGPWHPRGTTKTSRPPLRLPPRAVHSGAYIFYSGASWSIYPLERCILEHIPSIAVHPGAHTLYSGASWSIYPLWRCILEHIPSIGVHPGAYRRSYISI